MSNKTYLGDGVYIEYRPYDGYYEYILTTENGVGVTNTIVLEPEVTSALVRFIKTTIGQEEQREVDT